MALFETPAAATPAATQTRGRRDGNTPTATVWLNIGYTANDRFVSIPVGIPLDTMQFHEETGQNADWVNFRKAQNKLLKWLLEQSKGLEPGGTEEIEGLTLQLRRTGGTLTDEQLGQNPYENPNMVLKETKTDTTVLPR